MSATSLKIGDRIAYLRKKKGITQEDLARRLNVTNQSVSKWESGYCCPDIHLLPELASYFEVSIDELLGYKAAESFSNICLKLKSFMEEAGENNCFDLACSLASILAEGCFTKGYTEYVPWDTGKEDSGKNISFHDCGYSACSEPGGHAAAFGSSIFISSNKHIRRISNNDINLIHNNLSTFADKNVLRSFLAIYDLTAHDPEYYASSAEISEKSRLSAAAVTDAVDKLSLMLNIRDDRYRIDSRCMHLAPLLLMLRNG